MTAKMSSYAGADDVVKLYEGAVNGMWTLSRGVFSLEVRQTNEFFPPWSCTEKWGFTELMLPGKYQVNADGTTFTLTVETD